MPDETFFTLVKKKKIKLTTETVFTPYTIYGKRSISDYATLDLLNKLPELNKSSSTFVF